MKTVIKRIVWAVDTREPVTYYQNALFVLGALTRAMDCEVYPVHVFRLPDSRLEKLGDFQQAYLALAEKRMKELSELPNISRMAKGEVIECSSSTRAAVELLIEHAAKKAADLIVVSTHSKGAVSRFFLGSFAETLLLQSGIPVITVNPQTKVREKISSILFPTNFEPKFRPAFEQTVGLAKKFDAKITLFYKEPHYAMEELSPELYSFIGQEVKELREQATQWKKWAESQHVPVDYQINSMPGDVAEEIVTYGTEKNMDLIVMVSQTEQFASPRVGSLCRKVVRQSTCPVWTMKTDDLQPGEVN